MQFLTFSLLGAKIEYWQFSDFLRDRQNFATFFPLSASVVFIAASKNAGLNHIYLIFKVNMK
jgi:hypothetical protein